MGAAESQGIYSNLDIQHPQLRDFRGVTRDGITLMTASVLCQKPQFKTWSNSVSQLRSNTKDKEFLLMPVKYKYDEGGVCSTSGQVTIEYEYYPKILSAQIRDRMKDKKSFSQAQLWYLLYGMVAARDILISQGYQVGDLQPRNIFVNASQQVKIGCILSWPGQVSAYRKAVLEEGIGYLAPEDMERLRLGAMDNRDNTEAQIFSMGLTMLSASILQPMKDLYSVQNNKIDEQLFMARLALFQQDKSYSDIYRAVITNMLQMEVDHRMSQEQLSDFLSKHKDNLQNKKPLMFDNVGKKLQQSINTLLKKTNAVWSDGQKKSGQSFLYPDSKQNNLLNGESRQVYEGSRNMIKKSQPDRSHMVDNDGRPTLHQKLPMSPNGSRHHITFNNTGHPIFSEPQHLKQGKTNNSQMRTPSGNNPSSKVPNQINTPAWNSLSKYTSPYNSPLGRPPLVNAQSPRGPVPLVNAAPPLNGVHNAQPYRVVRIDSQQSKQNYRPFENIGAKQVTFIPSKQNGKKVSQSKISEEKSVDDVSEGSKSVNNLLMQTRKGAFVEMSKIERKKKYNQDDAKNYQKSQESKVSRPQQQELEYQNKLVQQIPNIIESRVEVKKSESSQQKELNMEDKQTSGQDKNLRFDSNNQIPISPILPTSPIEHLVDVVANQGEQSRSQESQVQTIRSSTEKQQEEKKVEVRKNQFSPSVKIWGVQKGKLTIQQIEGSPNESRTQTQSIKTEEKEAQPQAPAIQQQQGKIQQQETQQEQIINPQKQVLSQQANINKDNDSRQKVDNYILIQQSSRTTTQRTSQVKEDCKFIYLCKSTDGSFDECWAQLMNMLRTPQDYSIKIDEKKVQPCQNSHGQFIKVGPAAMKVYINHEQGKIWCQNLPSSRCVGDLLCGLIKEQGRKHYVWFNSSLQYKQRHFPTQEVMEEALTVIQGNIRALRTDQ